MATTFTSGYASLASDVSVIVFAFTLGELFGECTRFGDVARRRGDTDTFLGETVRFFGDDTAGGGVTPDDASQSYDSH